MSECSYIGCERTDSFWPAGYEAQPDDKPCCIFHSPLIEEKREKFEAEWQKFLETHQQDENEYGDLDCRGFVFPGDVGLVMLTFTGQAQFSEARFNGNASFFGTTFNANAEFNGAVFAGEAAFTSTIFNGETQFFKTIFRQDANFSLAECHGKFSLRSTRFCGNASFADVSVKDAEFELIGGAYDNESGEAADTRVFEGDQRVPFNQIDFSMAKQVRFEHVDLSCASFLGSRVEKVEFSDVWWHGTDSLELYDDRQWEAKDKQERNLDELHQIQELYRQLTRSSNKYRRYQAARTFHIRRHELRRQYRSFPGNLLEGIYKLLSNYGLSCCRPLFWFICTLLTASGLLGLFNPEHPLYPAGNPRWPTAIWPNIQFNLALVFEMKLLDFDLPWNILILCTVERLFLLLILYFFLVAVMRRLTR